jgi:hypothetical protein
MPYREDSLVQREKAVASDPILNQSRAERQRDQLTASHHPVLALGQLTDRRRRINVGRGHGPTVAGLGARVVR